MAKVLEDHKLPRHLEKILPEDRASRVQYLLADIFNVHPSENIMLKLIAETILKLAELGNVILIGRGGNIITAKLPHVLHVRLVAPLAERIRHAREPPQDTGRARELLHERRFGPRPLHEKILQRQRQRSAPLPHDRQHRAGSTTTTAAQIIGNAVLKLD